MTSCWRMEEGMKEGKIFICTYIIHRERGSRKTMHSWKSLGMTYNIKNEFHMQGYFAIKVTPMEPNYVYWRNITNECTNETFKCS